MDERRDSRRPAGDVVPCLMNLAEQAWHWRQKAEECRAVAEQMKNPMARETFMHLARTYDTLAERLERQDKRDTTEEAG